MSNKLKKLHVRESKDFSASTATASEQDIREALADEKITVEGEAEKVYEHNDKEDTDNVDKAHADTDMQEQLQIDSSSVTPADTRCTITGGKQEVLGGSSDDDDTDIRETTQKGHQAAEELESEPAEVYEFSLQETKTEAANVNSKVQSKSMPKPSNSDLSPDSFPQDIRNIIANLMVVVDWIAPRLEQARNLILELARLLDERKLCERGLISRKIKEILKDKIRAGKISGRWVEECLPPEYKRTYVKSELSSLSSSKRKRPHSTSTEPTQAPPIQLKVHESGHSIQQPSESDDANADTGTEADKQPGENEIISVKPQEQQEVTEVQPEENLTKTQEVGSGDDTRIDTDTSPPQPEQGASTNESEPGSMTASPTLPQSIDVHMGEDSIFSGPSDKSPVCANCLIKDNRIKKLEDENRELDVRCSYAESNNSELVLQLTAQENYINKLREEEHDLSHSPVKYIGQESPSYRELEEKVIELSEALKHTPMRTPDEIPASEIVILQEKYDTVRDAMDKSKGAIFVKFYGKKFARAVADVDN